MKFHRKVLPILMAVSLFLCCTTSVFAGVNFGNDDGSDFKHGTEENGWLVKTDNDDSVWHGYGYNLEGLRLTVYDAETQTKVYNTLDVTGEPIITYVSNIMHFADGTELIPKTTWLSSSYVGTTYNAVDAASIGKFQRATIDSSRVLGSGYKAEYVEGLGDIDIISSNNTSNYEEIGTLPELIAVLLALTAAKVFGKWNKRNKEIPLAPFLCAANTVVYVMEVFIHG